MEALPASLELHNFSALLSSTASKHQLLGFPTTQPNLSQHAFPWYKPSQDSTTSHGELQLLPRATATNSYYDNPEFESNDL